MADFIQNVISERFVEVLDELINRKTVKNMADFCKRIEYPLQSMSHIKKGKRDVTIDLIGKLFSQFNGNPIYLLSGKGEKVLSQYALSIVEEPNPVYNKIPVDNVQIVTLERLVDAKDQLIHSLRKEVARLEEELGKQRVKE